MIISDLQQPHCGCIVEKSSVTILPMSKMIHQSNNECKVTLSYSKEAEYFWLGRKHHEGSANHTTFFNETS